MSEPQKKKRINLPKDFDKTDRDRAADLILQTIVERTNSNIDYQGKRFKNYSDTYSNSLEFKIAGKSKNDPNLQLSGDMLNSIQVLESGTGYVTIGYKEGTDENDKATWAEREDNGPARKFLGLTDVELELIIEQVKVDRPTTLTKLANEETAAKVSRPVTKAAINSILKNLGIDTEE